LLGIIPAAGIGSRIQPLAFSKELLPVGSRLDGEVERPRAVSEYLVERMRLAGADRICFVISPKKSDIVEYYGASAGGAAAFYVVQPGAEGLCDAIFRALPFMERGEEVVVGLPDTVWFPANGLELLPADPLSFLLFPVERPELFDAVLTNPDGDVEEIQVKQVGDPSRWIWGAFKGTAEVFGELYDLWCHREPRDAYLGTLVNEYLLRGGRALGVRGGEAYVDVGTLHGYREAMKLLSRMRAGGPSEMWQSAPP
jgi:glucose-1-phosphate thymidylyltransferase